MPRFRVIPLELQEANALVTRWHRHHKPVRGHRFSIGCQDTATGEIVGAAIIGRPVARMVDYKTTLEITRLVTNGAEHACSFLYGAAARIAKELGYSAIQTYILEGEPGTSLLAAGWTCNGRVRGRQWVYTNGPPRRTDQPTCMKQRWYKMLQECRGDPARGM